jgi:hypothetical protein
MTLVGEESPGAFLQISQVTRTQELALHLANEPVSDFEERFQTESSR